VITVEIAARADLPIKYKFILVSVPKRPPTIATKKQAHEDAFSISIIDRPLRRLIVVFLYLR
jgi:hypothetical protein